jgi:signal transduction histidine kinase
MSFFLHFLIANTNKLIIKTMRQFFKIQHFLTFIFYLIVVVGVIKAINLVGVFYSGIDFLTWWPLKQSVLFGLGGVPDSILTANVSGLSMDIQVKGLDEHLKTHWLTRTGLSLLTICLFLTVLGTFRRMLKTVSIKQPFDFANIRRVQFIIALILFEIIVLDYWRTESMEPVKVLVEQMGGTIVGTDSSYQNADAFVYVLLLLLLTLLSIFRRGLALYQEQRILEEKLHQKKKLAAVGTLASGVGHDFNNMLTSIIGYAELAKVSPESEEGKYALKQVLDASYRAKRLTQQIRAIGGQHNLAKYDEVLDLKEEINEWLISIEPTIHENINVMIKFDQNKCYHIVADPTKLYQVLLNLSTNALQAMKAKGGSLSIDIESRTHNKKLGYYVSIADNGCGITQSQQSQIFEPYFTTKHQVGGTGLGLTLCHSIVESYNGFIEVSSSPNEGSTFSIWLPEQQKITQYS